MAAQCAYWTAMAQAIRPILDFGGAKFPKMGDFLPWTLMNRPAKFNAASFILRGEICNRTNKKNRQTVNDMSAPCLSAYVDNNAGVCVR